MSNTQTSQQTQSSVQQTSILETKTEAIPSKIPEMTEEQKKFLDALNELLMATQELSFAVALVPNEAVEKYSEISDLVATAKNVVRATYRLHKIVKGMRR